MRIKDSKENQSLRLILQISQTSLFCSVCLRWLTMWINTRWANIAVNHSEIRRVEVAFTVRPNVGSLHLGSWLKSLYSVKARTWRSYSKLVRSGDKELLERCVDPTSARKTAPRTSEVIQLKVDALITTPKLKSVWLISPSEADEVSKEIDSNRIVTWLILPVVICLSQRLSHACLSINKFLLWNCEWLIKSVIVYLMVPCYMDNCGNSRANTCWKAPTSGRGVFIR